MDDETRKVHVCRDIVFNETDFGETDHGTVLELETSDDEQLLTCNWKSLCLRIKWKRETSREDRPEN